MDDIQKHVQELYAENKKLSNLLKLVLDIDALTTKEFCDMYRQDHPAYRGSIDLAVMEMFAVDSHKWHLIKDAAKEVKKKLQANVKEPTHMQTDHPMDMFDLK